MRRRLTILLFIACLLSVGRTTATPGLTVPTSDPTPQPAQYLSLVMNKSNLGQFPLTATVGLSGTVYLNPRWAATQPDMLRPVQYLVLMDVTGSMSWDFNGYGTYDGSNTGGGYIVPNSVRGDVQCDSPNNPNPLNLPYTDRCIGGLNSAWNTTAERRVYVIKQAIASMIDRMSAADTMRIIAFSTSTIGNAAASPDWISDKAALKTSVLTLGAYSNDPYKTSGGASNAIAMRKVHDLLAAAPTMAPNGQPYKQVVLLLTDSVANVFLDGTSNTARDVCAALTVQQALETADPCQIGTTSAGKLRPISAMIDVANKIKSEHPYIEIYVVGLAHVDETGLTKVGNDSSYFYAAPQPDLVGIILEHILSSAISSVCQPAGGNQWIDSIDPAHLPDLTVFPGLSDTVAGYSYLYDMNGIHLYTLPIQRDLATGKLGWRLAPPDAAHPSTGIAPGTYELAAYVGYKGDDLISRQYDWLINPSSLNGASRIILTISPDNALGPVIPIDPVFLDLRPTVKVCP